MCGGPGPDEGGSMADALLGACAHLMRLSVRRRCPQSLMRLWTWRQHCEHAEMADMQE